MSFAPPALSADQVRRLLTLNVETGELRWTAAATLGRRTGMVAGSRQAKGYIQIKIGTRVFLAHRLIWFMVHGEWPQGQIDHINGVRTDNALSNLRCVTAAQNKQNIAVTGRKSKSGLVGAIPRLGKWDSRIKLNGISHCLGRFETPEAAHAAYMSAKAELHPFFSRAVAQ